ncbi:hypothetical protein X739_00905 [Mesorhizobium sp. LNHC220B00]|nr:hypothetical protein X739_00905 [Mesorhizobium sp. LNHC220B00]
MKFINSRETRLVGKSGEPLAHPFFSVLAPDDGLSDGEIAGKHRQIVDPQRWGLDGAPPHQS